MGFVVGTRPDCLSPAVFKLWQAYHERSFVAVEIGVQSFFDKDLEFLRRGHSAKDSISAIHKIAQETNVDLGIHLIFGLPGETSDQILQTAEIVNGLPISNVKLHNLHVLTQTPLEKLYRDGNFKPVEFEDYANRVRLFLEHLRPGIAIQRLSAFAPRWDELVAPAWTGDKMRSQQGIIDHLRSHSAYQSRCYRPKNDEEISLQSQLQLRSVPIAVRSARSLSMI